MTQFNEVGLASELEKPKKCPCQCRIIGIAILVVLIAGAICWHVHRPKPIGLKPEMLCRVHLISDVSITGFVVAVNSEAILLQMTDDIHLNRVWIPRSNVVFIEYRKLQTE